METPSEWAKRFNERKSGETANAPKAEATAVDSPATVAEFPTEPFQCPACGQLLGPSCRVCVSCKKPINPADIARISAVVQAESPARFPLPKADPVRYPWRILIAVMGIGLILGVISVALLGQEKGPMLVQALPILAGIWVFFDAFRRRLPRPMRWGLGTMLLLAVVFPWYLARRNKPQSPVPFVEAEVGPKTRILLIALLVFFLIGLIVNIWQNPQPDSTPNSTPKIQQGGDGSPSRITHMRPPATATPSMQGARVIPSPAISSQAGTLPAVRMLKDCDLDGRRA